MKLSTLLAQRSEQLRLAHLANLAFAFSKLDEFAGRIARAQIRGDVCLQSADPAAGRYEAVLTALEGSQSVIEEHFTDNDITLLADALAFTTGETDVERTFRIEQLAGEYLEPLRQELARSGVFPDRDLPPVADPNRGS